MKATSIRLSKATINTIKKIKEKTGLQTYNDVVFFVLSQYEEKFVVAKDLNDKDEKTASIENV
jgi:hypothetical protein